MRAAADALRELGHHALERLRLGQRRSDHVAGPVGDDRLTAVVGVELAPGRRDRRRGRRSQIRWDGLRSSQTSVRFEPPIVVVRTLIGLSQLTCTCAIAPSRQLERQVGDAGLSGADRVGAVRRHRKRRAALRQDEVEDREVVRREVPEHVDVALDEARG